MLPKIDRNKLMKFLKEEYRYISDIEKYCNFDDYGGVENGETPQYDSNKDVQSKSKGERQMQKPLLDVKKRLRGFEEIEAKLKEIKGKTLGNVQEKRYKKNLKTRLKREEKKRLEKDKKKKNKIMKKEKVGGKSEIELEKDVNKKVEEQVKQGTVLFNKDDKMMFSKIDFTGLGNDEKKKKRKESNEPESLLWNLKKQKVMLNEMEESGEKEKVKTIKEKDMWRAALKRSQGVKVKDDEELLKKSVRKKRQLKNRSKKKWEARTDQVDKKKEERQKKREENIAARRKEKKKTRMKKALKRGKVIL